MYTPPAESTIPFKWIYSKSKENSSLNKLIKFNGTEEAVLFSKNARSLLRYLAGKILEPNEEILLPAYTCESVIYAFIHKKIKLYDLDRQTFAPNLESIRENISSRTKAILVQDLFGLNIDLDHIIDFARSKDLLVIYDSSQYLSSFTDNKKGDFQLFSFGRGKPLPIGMGGLLRINSSSFLNIKNSYVPEGSMSKFKGFSIFSALQIAKISFLYTFVEKFYLSRKNGLKTYNAFDYKYYDASFLQSIIAKAFGALRKLNEHRRKIAKHYKSSFDEKGVIDNPNSIFIRYPYLSNNPSISKDLYKLGVRHMYKNNIELSDRFKCISTNSDLSSSDYLEDFLITLPTHSSIDKEKANKVISYLT